MELGVVLELVGEIHQVRVCPTAGREDLTASATSVARVRAWLDGCDADVAARLAACSSFPQADLAAAARTSVRDADRVLERAGVLEQAPVFGNALNDAKVTAGHVDALGRTLRSLEPAQRDGLLALAGELAEVAEQATVEEFGRRLRAEARRLQADDGLSRFERQRRDTRLRTWVDQTTGMWRLAGRFDPKTGVDLSARLEATIDALFVGATPGTCPSDPLEKQDHLRALALAALLNGKAAGGGRVEIIAVVDATDTDPATGGPVIDWGLPVEIPMRVLRDLWGIAHVRTVVVRNGIVLHAPGVLNAGRTIRVANRAQRRALRALYRTCAIPGCQVRYHHCKLHHIIWWEHDGLTDLDNLLPVCEQHHHAIHDLGWRVALGPNRELTVDLPDGTRYTTGPPQRGREHVIKTTTPRSDPNRPRGPTP